MKVKYTGKNKVRIEGVGYFEAKDVKEVDEVIGKQLCKSVGFREVTSKKETKKTFVNPEINTEDGGNEL